MEDYTLPLVDNFQRFFKIELATTDAQKEAAFGIRYRVYCEELGLEPADQFPDKMEHDQYDEYSLACLVTHKRSGLPAGCVRMVETCNDRAMPFEPHCRDSLNVEYAQLLYEERETVVECSRLAVDGTFRRRIGEDHTRLGEYDALDCCHLEHRSFSLIGIATLLAGFAAADLVSRPNILAMMEPYLPRLLRRQGILVQKAGKRVKYHGMRAPYFMNTRAAAPNMRPDLQMLYKTVRAQLHAQLAEREEEAA